MDVYIVNPIQFAKHVNPATLSRMAFASLYPVDQYLSCNASLIRFQFMEIALVVLHIAWDTQMMELVNSVKMEQL